jgi:hypothetical protein
VTNKTPQDADIQKGAVEGQEPNEEGNTSLRGQLPHRNQNPLIKANDSDFPEPGNNPEHSGEPQGTPAYDEANPEGATQTQEPGHRQKRNQADEGDDPLAA